MALRSPLMFSQLLWTSRIWWGVNLVWGSAKSSAFLFMHKNIVNCFHEKRKLLRGIFFLLEGLGDTSDHSADTVLPGRLGISRQTELGLEDLHKDDTEFLLIVIKLNHFKS